MTDISPYKTLPDISGRLYAIGDIHGCIEELEILLTYLEHRERITSKDLIVFIGDYVDRGDNSKGVIELLIDFQSRHPQTVFLKGNHEVMLMDFLGLEGDCAEVYLPNGGLKTLDSYGVPHSKLLGEAIHYFPEPHIHFLQNLDRIVVNDKYIFVHAGLQPLRNLDEQSDSNIYWIRDEFIQNIHRFGKIIIFGHTPFEDVLFDLPYKIGIDTGLVYGNKLTCLDLTQGRALQILLGAKKVIIRDL